MRPFYRAGELEVETTPQPTMSTTVEEPTFVKAFLSLLHSNGQVQLGDDYVYDGLSARPLTVSVLVE